MNKAFFKNRPEHDTPEYKSWRYSVMVSDGFKCVKCGGKKSLQAHHILKWADFPKLRYLKSNGVTLCENCHELTIGREEKFIDEFKAIVQMRKYTAGAQTYLKNKAKKYTNKKYKPPNPYLRF